MTYYATTFIGNKVRLDFYLLRRYLGASYFNGITWHFYCVHIGPLQIEVRRYKAGSKVPYFER